MLEICKCRNNYIKAMTFRYIFSSRASPEAHFDDYVRISFSYYEADVLKAAMVKFSDLINSMLHDS